MIVVGDCVEEMAKLAPGSVDAVVCDPPYGLEFMGKDWDRLSGQPGYVERGRITDRPDAQVPYGRGGGVNSYQAGRPMQEWHEAWAREALRVLKPGGHLLAFGGTRTYHRLACAIEDAGFEIRDNIGWSHLEEVFCACDSPMRGVRQPVSDVPTAAKAREGADVLSSVQREAPREGVGEARAQGASGVDGGERRELPNEDERRGESGVEGRRNDLAEGGQLSADQVRARADVGAADGAEGWLRDGAPAPDGRNRGATAQPDGGGASHRPRSDEQRADEPGALAVEWISQGGGAWPGCPRCGKPLAPPFFGGPLAWKYGSGFPKSLDVSKAIDKAAGVEREVVARGAPVKRMIPGADQNRTGSWIKDNGREFVPTRTAPATDAAERWEGWGTALKPAFEPIVVARKPLAGTVAGNVLAHGTGALNIDGCRVATSDNLNGGAYSEGAEGGRGEGLWRGTRKEDTQAMRNGGLAGQYQQPPGRWPANVALDEGAAVMLDEQTGELRTGKLTAENQRRGGFAGTVNAYGKAARGGTNEYEASSGGASRFFYTAKVSRGERNAGVDRNLHPTVKPISLMRWLVRLVTPPGGLIVDPFVGSGTTGCAAALEGFDFIGIERDAEYARIAEARIAFWREHPTGPPIDAALEADARRRDTRDAGQLGLL